MPKHRTIVLAEGTLITSTRRVQACLVVEDGREPGEALEAWRRTSADGPVRRRLP